MQSAPNRIGKYELLSRLGRGGMGEVYKAFHPQLQRYVAIKVLLTTSETDPEFIARFQNEAMAVARLRHPNIVQVFDFDIQDDKPYMVMEFVEGETLAQRMTRYHQAGRLVPTDEVVRLFQQLCAAVDYAHKQGMLHRDIKPANVIINRQGNAVLTDFGLAKISGVSGLTASGIVIGTPHYMSPEQGQGQPMDARSDVYSLSIMLYEILAGKLPFDADTPVGIIMQHVTTPPPPIERANPAVSGALAQVALVGMAKKPEERFRSAGAMGAAIASATNLPPMQITTGAPERLAAGSPDPLETVAMDAKAANDPAQVGRPGSHDTRATMLAQAPDTSARQAANAGGFPAPSAIGKNAPPDLKPDPLRKAQPAIEYARRTSTQHTGRFILIGSILLLLIIGSGILLIALGNKSSAQPTGANTPATVGTVTFSDSDPTDFTHPANILKAGLTNLKQPPGGFNDFAWLCDAGAGACKLLGPLQVQKDNSAILTDTAGASWLGVNDVTKLATTLTFKITQEQTEASSPPASPSQNVVYAGQIEGKVLLHIRHQIVAFPSKGDLFPGNTTALDTGLGSDAMLLDQLAQQMQNASTLKEMKLTAEDILNLIVGKDGEKDWDHDGHTAIFQGDDGFGLGTDATVNASDCSGPQNSSYLALTMQHACLAARASGSSTLLSLFIMIQKAGANISTSIASIEQIAQNIAGATDASSVSQGAVNTLVEQADTVLNGVTGETQRQDGARQILLYSEAMATITVSPA